MPSWRIVVLPLAVGLVLVLTSVFLVGRDLLFARQEADREVLALVETAALAVQFAPPDEVEPYVAGLLKHPAITTVTVYSSNGNRRIHNRLPAAETPLIATILAPLRDPVVGCKATGATSLCIEADMSYFQQRAAALLVPHALLLAASLLLLVFASIAGGGADRRRVADLSRIIRTAIDENNYSIRAAEGKGQMGELAVSVNRLLEQMQERDLTLRRRSTELEAANQELEAFTYSVSHDLRAPLASVAGFSQAVEEFYAERLDDAGKQYLRWIQEATVQMQNLISGLLQMSRLARLQIERTRVDLTAIADSLAEEFRQRAPERSVEFRIERDLVAAGDERLLRAVLENLMSNAFKFTGKKEKAIIEVASRTENGRRVYFVRDNGAGFDSTQAAKMFGAFQRLHSQSEFEGTGVGLSTVKRIVERHGGSIWADGRPGEGATFSFTLSDAPIPGEKAPARELTQVG
jgi:signal transduction histidine kinase